jgi:flagellar hook assembly protein FlgD
VRTLVNEEKNAGIHRAVWDGRDNGGNLVGAGVYFCRLEGANTPGTKMVLVR